MKRDPDDWQHVPWPVTAGIVVALLAGVVAVHYLHLIVPLVVIAAISCLVPRHG